MVADSRLPNFRSLTPAERLRHVADAAALSPEDVARLASPGALPLGVADGMIENVIGTFELPFAVAGNFRINGRDVLVPMVVEEPSVVAAASFMAKLARDCGGFETSSTGPIMRAQVQVIGVTDPHGARLAILRQRDEIVNYCMRLANGFTSAQQSPAALNPLSSDRCARENEGALYLGNIDSFVENPLGGQNLKIAALKAAENTLRPDFVSALFGCELMEENASFVQRGVDLIELRRILVGGIDQRVS